MAFEHDVNIARRRRARLWVLSMTGGKLFAYCGFLLLTILGIVWFLQDGICFTGAGKERYSSGFKMAF